MDKVYLVTKGEYSVYHICAVFAEKKNAEIFVEAIKEDSWSVAEIEEWNLDEAVLEKGDKNYFVRIKKDGEVLECHTDGFTCSLNETGFDMNHNMFSYQFAKDEKHAVKIANERRARLIAENRF